MSDTPRPGDEHTRNVSEMFGRMTPWYDLQNRVFSLFLDCWWRHNLVRSVVPGPTNTVIDMAAGTLDVTFTLVRSGIRGIILRSGCTPRISASPCSVTARNARCAQTNAPA